MNCPAVESLTNRWRKGRKETGIIAVIVALTFPFLMAFMALSLDIGYVYHTKRRMQAAADAGAMAGAVELYRRNSSLVTFSAKNDAKLNGYDPQAPDVQVEVNCPPTSGPRVPVDTATTCTQSGFVEVIITRTLPTYFMRLVGWTEATVQSRAVAGAVPFDAHPCIIALNRTVPGALTVPGTSNLQANCGVMVNSTDPQALQVQGDACINATEVAVTGSYDIQGSQQCVNPPPVDEVPPVIDPLAHIDPPTMPAGTQQPEQLVLEGNGTYTLQPGRYKGGIKISGNENLVVNFAPGIYWIDGGGLLAEGTPNLIGNDVMFYNSLNPNVSSGKFGVINIGGSVHVELYAPTSGYYQGILFFNDRDAPDPTTEPFYEIRGDADSVYGGALYFPSVHVDLQGGASTVSPWTFLIADTITVRGNYVAKSVSDSNNPPGPPLMKPTLVE